jgi:hypothetical protein
MAKAETSSYRAAETSLCLEGRNYGYRCGRACAVRSCRLRCVYAPCCLPW